MNGKQKYTPVMSSDTDEAALTNPKGWPKVERLEQGQDTETPRMRSAHVPVVNPVTAGDRSVRGRGRVYEKGKKNQSRS